uniref:Uncharacterized protein n=1 Tax=Fervidobacterium thailandense TaxID=1008305 RepID=A0A7C4RXB7_9BACT
MIKKLIFLALLLAIIIVISLTSNREFNTPIAPTSVKSKVFPIDSTNANNNMSSDTEPKRITEGETSLIIVTNDGTLTTIVESSVRTDDVERIYEDFLKLEKIIRRYLSGGHRISMLSFPTLKELGYLQTSDEYLKYNYKILVESTRDGYNIILENTELLTPYILEQLKARPKVRLINNRVLQYVFWVKAFKNF